MKSESFYCIPQTNTTLYYNKKKFFKENTLKGYRVEPPSRWMQYFRFGQLILQPFKTTWNP